uniref:Reverse transcriptase domain-containing protein n=1 Tax=Nothobranchius kuhntae TaxID=321403 RepID=A0A1A8HT42_NOTKU
MNLAGCGLHVRGPTRLSERWNSYRRTADHSSLASLTRTANAHGCDSTTINFGLLNIRSLTGKGHLIHDLINDRGIDFMCLCETWQQPADFSQLNDATPPGNKKDINIDTLSSYIDNIQLPGNLSSPDDLAALYNDQLAHILNVLAPVKTRSVTFCQSAPWFSPQLRTLKTKSRQLERLYRKTGITIHKELYKNHMTQYKDLITLTKQQYYSCLINSNRGNTKSFYSIINKIHWPSDSLPPHMCSTATCNALLLFFNEKIINIHRAINQSIPPTSPYDPPKPTQLFSIFQLPSDSEISDIIHKSKPSTCLLDPLPTALIKSCLPSLLPLVSALIHASLSSGIVPSIFKTAAVTPILNKPGSDSNIFTNLCPISNLPFVSRVLEKNSRYPAPHPSDPKLLL